MLRKIAKKSRNLALANLPVPGNCGPLVLCFHTVGCSKGRRGYVSSYRSQPLVQLESQLEWLSGFCDFVSLDDVVGETVGFGSSRQRVALTFDDGYQDNVHVVLPVLEKYNAPVTFFIATDYLSDKKLPWWDFMDWSIEHGFSCDLASGQVVRKELSAATAEVQRQHFREVCRDGAQISRDSLVDSIADRCGCSEVNDFMTFEELSEVAKNPLVTIGAHTHSHFNTALLTADKFSGELNGNLNRLENCTQSKIDYFAYPYGGEMQVAGDHSTIFQESGITAAFTTIPECVDGRHGEYGLPRMIVSPRSDLSEFKAQFKRALVRNKFPSLSMLKPL